MRLLARACDITALCFERSSASGTAPPGDIDASRATLNRFADVEIFQVPHRHRRLRYAWDHLRSTAMRRVYTTYLYDSPAFPQRLNEILPSDAIDLLRVDNHHHAH